MKPVVCPSLFRPAGPVPDARFPDSRKALVRGVGRTLPCILFLLFANAALWGCKGFTAGAPRPGRDDAAIAAHIRTLIAQDPELKGSEIRVLVLEGKVNLSGTVPDAGAKLRLLDAARAVDGVKSVADNLEVRKGPG